MVRFGALEKKPEPASNAGLDDAVCTLELQLRPVANTGNRLGIRVKTVGQFGLCLRIAWCGSG
jgi:hypothetical protein